MALPPPLTRPLDVVLHLGMGKTGTSSIQFFLRDHRETLASRGLLYPETPGRGRHHKLGLSVKSVEELESSPEWRRLGQPDPARFRRRFRRGLLTEIEDSGLSRVLFSDEVLFGGSRPTLRRLARFTEDIARTRRLVVYLRRQDDHMVSRYQEGVKIGWVVGLEEWAREDMSDLYDYRARLGRQRRLFAPVTLVVRRFERPSFVDGSLVQDFQHAVGIEAPLPDPPPGAERNRSLDAESVEFLRVLNLYRVEHEGAVAGRIDNRDLVRRLSDTAIGPTLTMPEPFLDSFMTRWERSNRAVARDFLDDSTGELFRLPRNRANVTTEQLLDPARLDRYLELLALPERLHRPLRAIAEREASPR